MPGSCRSVRRPVRRLVLVGVGALCVASGLVPQASSPAHARRHTRRAAVPIEQSQMRGDAASIARWHRRVAASLSRSVREQYGPVPAAGRAVGSDWFGPGDVGVYVLESGPQRGRVIGVPLGARVGPDGSVAFPEAAAAAAGGGALARRVGRPTGALLAGGSFDGPWGKERLDTWVVYDVDDGGVFCNTTRGEIRMRALRRRLKDSSRRYDYVGIDVKAVAEITGFASNCDDFLGRFSVGVWSMTPGAIWLDQDPVSGSTGACRTIGVSASAGLEALVGVSASVTSSYQRCERWRVDNGVPVPPDASKHYNVRYEHADISDNEQREAGMVAVVRLPPDAALDPQYGLGLDVEND